MIDFRLLHSLLEFFLFDLVQFPVQGLLSFQSNVLILEEIQVKIAAFTFSALNQTTVVGKVFREVDTCVVIMAIPLCRKHVGGLLTPQELYGSFREETPVEDENFSADIKLIDRVIQRFYILHTARKRANHCWQFCVAASNYRTR